MQKFNIEYTDTFGGEANYSWVRRATIEVPDNASDLTLVRLAKKVIGLTGVKCKREQWGDDIVLRPYSSCTICFITFKE